MARTPRSPAVGPDPRRAREERPASANYHANALSRGLSLLEHLVDGPRTLAELSEGTGLPKSTLVRLLAVLAELQYVVRLDEQPTYRLGHKVRPLSRAYERALDVPSLAASRLRELATTTGHTANLGVLDGDSVVHVCVEEPDRPLRFTSAAGSRDALHSTGLGKVLLAGLEPGELPARLPPEPFPAHTVRTLTTAERLRDELARVREQGYALDDEERSTGLRCLAVPVPDPEGAVLAAVSISGPAAEFTDQDRPGHLAELGRVVQGWGAEPDLATAIARLARSLRRG